MTADLQGLTLFLILGIVLAIVYSLRILVLLERRIARMDHHVELMAMNLLEDEKKLIASEERLEKIVKKAVGTSKKSSTKKKSSKKKKTTKKSTKKSSKKKSSKKKSKK